MTDQIPPSDDELRAQYDYLFNDELPPEMAQRLEEHRKNEGATLKPFSMGNVRVMTLDAMKEHWKHQSVLARHSFYYFIMRPDGAASTPTDEYASKLPEKLKLHEQNSGALVDMIRREKAARSSAPSTTPAHPLSHQVASGGPGEHGQFGGGGFIPFGQGGNVATHGGIMIAVGAGGGGGGGGQGIPSGTIFDKILGTGGGGGGNGGPFSGAFQVSDATLSHVIRQRTLQGQESIEKMLDMVINAVGFADTAAALRRAQDGLNHTIPTTQVDTPPEGAVPTGSGLPDTPLSGDDIMREHLNNSLAAGHELTLVSYEHGKPVRRTLYREDGTTVTTLYPTGKPDEPEPQGS